MDDTTLRKSGQIGAIEVDYLTKRLDKKDLKIFCYLL